MSSCTGVAFLPYALYVLCAAPLGRALGTAAAALALTAGPLLVIDRVFYGRWTVRDLPGLSLNQWLWERQLLQGVCCCCVPAPQAALEVSHHTVF